MDIQDCCLACTKLHLSTTDLDLTLKKTYLCFNLNLLQNHCWILNQQLSGGIVIDGSEFLVFSEKANL